MKLETIILDTPYLSLGEEFFSQTQTIALDETYLISYSEDAARLLELDNESLDKHLLVKMLNGEFKPQGSKPFSMAYAGHQFGNYNPWLGDGRVCNLGKYNGWNLQLKGSGETYYARGADGRATIRSSIREYLMSEAMHHLGIPSTRALAVIGSKTKILRDGMEYAGIVLRMAKSWVRFGSFEYFYYTKEYAKLESLAEYVIAESYPEFIGNEDRFYKMFCEVLMRTSKLLAKWQATGFNHGVLNTDNMSIEGITIDYGPFAMLDDFNYSYKCNHSDRAGRYSYGEQVNVVYWNLTMFAKALSPLVSQERMDKKLQDFGEYIYADIYISLMREKLGLEEKLTEDRELVTELIGALQDALVDYTLFFRTLSHYSGDREILYDIVMEPVVIDKWLQLYDKRLEKESLNDKERNKKMLKINPKYVLKNYMIDEAISFALAGNFSKVEALLDIAQHPYEELMEYDYFAQDTPEEYKNIGLKCSS